MIVLKSGNGLDAQIKLIGTISKIVSRPAPNHRHADGARLPANHYRPDRMCTGERRMPTKTDLIAELIGVELIILMMVFQKELHSREIIEEARKAGFWIDPKTIAVNLARMGRRGLLQHRRDRDPISRRAMYYFSPTKLGHGAIKQLRKVLKLETASLPE